MTLQEQVARVIDLAIWTWHDDCVKHKVIRIPSFELRRRASLAIARQVIALVRRTPE